MTEPRPNLLHQCLTGIDGSLLFGKHVKGVGLYDFVEVIATQGHTRYGRVVAIDNDNIVVEVFQGSDGLSLSGTRLRFLHEPIMLNVGKGMLGRVFDGMGRPLDGGPPILASDRRRVDAPAINPTRRAVPNEFIETGISAIDGLNSLVRGQKLPIFSGSGLSHDRLATLIARFARLRGAQSAERFAVVFAAIGVTFDTAERFRREMEDYGALEHITLFLNLANDPSTERLITPRVALTTAEYLAFDELRHVLVILTDMTNYCEALRELSSSHGEVASRKGFPGYMYSDLARIYERAGRIIGRQGSITQLPILTMPNDDITHPIADLTGYITEGQILLDRDLERSGIFPPIKLLPSLSRLMREGTGKAYTYDDHPALAEQLYTSYAQVHHLRLLSSIIGEEALTPSDMEILRFGDRFERRFIHQSDQRRTLEETLEIGWQLLRCLPEAVLLRLSEAQLTKHIRSDHSDARSAQ